ncbi:response regulator [Deinococcus yavapaiensis]|uniref:Response regulator receiver domain-containing protein n=1 Tax=Deinococcus yavapaiensis KR-236 TaxID=694435 RepID=A0A318S321_9DEIO|nr:response regulator [Deinococcus yavapaiensis]PYE50487.1 response regulator receiver domain-containing protein [Deinococcus yavapaiensis KR-236]
MNDVSRQAGRAYPEDETHPFILVIEDNEADSDLLRQAFACVTSPRIPVVLRVEHDGMAGLEAARHVQPRLILLDLGLPTLDGLEVLQALKADALTQSIPIIVFTEQGADEQVMAAYRRYANAYVRKVGTFDEMCRVVEAVTRFWLGSVLLPGDGWPRVPT